MFLLDWFYSMLGYLGLYRKSAKILFLGLDNAGKTTLLAMLKEGKVATFSPTIYPNSEELIIDQIRFNTFDLGGHETARRLWRDYYNNVDGIVYIVDAAESERFSEARKELNSLLSTEELSEVPVLVLGNKIDLEIAAGEAVLRDALGLVGTTTGVEKIDRSTGVRPIELFMCSIVLREGYVDGFRWLAQFLDDIE